MLRKFRILWFVPFVFVLLAASSASAQTATSPLTGAVVSCVGPSVDSADIGVVEVGCIGAFPVQAAIMGSALSKEGEKLTGYASLYSRDGDAWQLVMQAGLEDGRFRFDGLGFDIKHLVTVSAEGFSSGEGQEVETSANAEPFLHFVLEPLPATVKIAWHSSRTVDGKIWVLAEVKNNSFPSDQWAVMPATISGPGEFSERSEVSSQYYLGMPVVGQTWWYFLSYEVPFMKDGHLYDFRASIGAVGGETYSPVYASVVKLPLVLGF